jgi:hypothetical protein
MVCEVYEMKVGEYTKEALIESLKEEVTEGDFCSLLASKLDDNMKVDKDRSEDKAVSNQADEIDDYPL